MRGVSQKFLFLLLMGIILVSCSTTNPKSKLLIGTWKAHKASAYYPTGKEPIAIPEMNNTDSTQKTVIETRVPKGADVDDEVKMGRLRRIIDAQQQATIKINADKTGEVIFPGRTLQTTWKMKKKGTNLIVKDIESGQKRVLEFVFINDTIAVAIQNTEAGDIIVRYRKQ